MTSFFIFFTFKNCSGLRKMSNKSSHHHLQQLQFILVWGQISLVLKYMCFVSADSTELVKYEGCSNMNASGFITFSTYMLRQTGIRFYKGLYVTFKLAPDIKKNTVYLSSYGPLNEGHVSILTNPMLRTYTSDIDERIILR